MAPQTALIPPKFSSSVIQPNRTDGYWVETIKFHKDDRVPGVVASGLVSGVIEFLDNPIAEAEAKKSSSTASVDQPWTKYVVGTFNTPVAVIAHDVRGSGLCDLIICHQYGPFMLDVLTDGGHISWLENPGRDKLGNGPWKSHYIGRWPSMHRLRVGHFTQSAYLEVVGAPIVRGPHDKASPIPMLLFTAPDNLYEAKEWPRTVIDDSTFTIIHECVPRKLNGPDKLDSLVVSSREGVTVMTFDPATHAWKHDRVGPGEPQTPDQTPWSETPGSGAYWGTGSADVGRIGSDPYAYVATLDPFHGVAACVYAKDVSPLDGRVTWTRHVLDVYGTPNQRLKTGDGPGHYIVCADFDGDGDDEFLLSLYGPLDRDPAGNAVKPPAGPHPDKGLMYYKAIDLKRGIFAKWRVSDASSARVCLGDFAGSGRLDVVSMAYNVKLYYEEPNPQVTLHRNEFAPIKTEAEAQPSIFATLWDNEGMIYLVDPSVPKNRPSVPSVAPLIEVANYAISVEVYPPAHEIPILEDGIKVLFGSVVLAGSSSSSGSNDTETRGPFSVDPFTAKSTKAPSSDTRAHADKTLGAILLRFHPLGSSSASGPYASAADVPVKTTMALPAPLPSPLPALEFKRVGSLWWGKPFAGLDFFNLSGFHFYLFSPNSSPSAPSGHLRLAHIQFWTAATGVNCGVHNHASDSFAEVHVCLSAGTGDGSMARLKPEYADEHDPAEYNDLPRDAFDWLPLAELDEHGGFWDSNDVGNPVRAVALPDTIKYPWHKWHAGEGTKGVDVWMAIEFNPDAVDRAVGLGQTVANAGQTSASALRKQAPLPTGVKGGHRGCC